MHIKLKGWPLAWCKSSKNEVLIGYCRKCLHTMTLVGELNHSGQRPVPQRATGHQVRQTRNRKEPSSLATCFRNCRQGLDLFSSSMFRTELERGRDGFTGIWEWERAQNSEQEGNRWQCQTLGNASLTGKKHSKLGLAQSWINVVCMRRVQLSCGFHWSLYLM